MSVAAAAPSDSVSPSSAHPNMSPVSPHTQQTTSLIKTDTASSPYLSLSIPAGSSDSSVSPAVTPRTQTAKQKETCEKVLEEIVATERVYLANLQQVVSTYLTPLKDRDTQSDLGLKAAQVSTIFSNLEGIVGFHAILHEELAACLKAQPPEGRVDKMASSQTTMQQHTHR